MTGERKETDQEKLQRGRTRDKHKYAVTVGVQTIIFRSQTKRFEETF
jgi:hypothetical protein